MGRLSSPSLTRLAKIWDDTSPTSNAECSGLRPGMLLDRYVIEPPFSWAPAATEVSERNAAASNVAMFVPAPRKAPASASLLLINQSPSVVCVNGSTTLPTPVLQGRSTEPLSTSVRAPSRIANRPFTSTWTIPPA